MIRTIEVRHKNLAPLKRIVKDGTNESIYKANCNVSFVYFPHFVDVVGRNYCRKHFFDALWYGQPLFWIPMLVGGLGPAISVYIIHRQSNQEFREESFFGFVFRKSITGRAWLLFVAYLIWRSSMVWFAFGISEPIAVIYLFINLPLFVIGGGFEEIGWQGYLQPKLEQRFNYTFAVLVVGAIWGVWHLPLWFVIGTVQSALPFGIYLLLAVILNVTFTTIYKYTKSIVLCILSHAWFNGCIGLAVYIGSDGYLQLDLTWKVLRVFIIEVVISFALAITIISKTNTHQPELHSRLTDSN